MKKTLMEELLIYGKIIGKYKLDLEHINDINKKYEKAKDHLSSYGPRLAGRLDSELNMMTVIQSTTAFKKLSSFIDDYINTCKKYKLLQNLSYNLEIIGCWMNDMKAGEYNPAHTHHDNTGYSTVLFLSIPEFIDDTKDSHKFKDGQLNFINVNGSSSTSYVPEVGDFYVFEASHMHLVYPFKTKNPNDIRRSMSFNFLLTKNEIKTN